MKSDIARMVEQFESLLRQGTAAPERPISELRLLSEADEQWQLAAWRDTKREYAREQSVHQIFEEQVERTPEAMSDQLRSGAPELPGVERARQPTGSSLATTRSQNRSPGRRLHDALG